MNQKDGLNQKPENAESFTKKLLHSQGALLPNQFLMLLTLLILVSAFILNLLLPWWSIAIPGLVFGYYFNKKAVSSFGLGFLALFLLWGGQALYIHFANDAILSTRIAEMLQVGSPLLVVLITGVLGGLVSGLATLTGSLVKETPRKFTD